MHVSDAVPAAAHALGKKERPYLKVTRKLSPSIRFLVSGWIQRPFGESGHGSPRSYMYVQRTYARANVATTVMQSTVFPAPQHQGWLKLPDGAH